MQRLLDRMRGRGESASRPALPTGTLTFMLTDIQGSTRLWEAEPDAMRTAIARHNAIIYDAVERHGGVTVRERGEGDSTFSVFTSSPAAVAAAIDMQRALHTEHWPSGVELCARVALHTGDARIVDEDYAAPAINRCARIREAAHGGQILASESTLELAEPMLPQAAWSKDLGTHLLRDLARPIRIFQVCHPDLAEEFPALRSMQQGTHNLPVQLTHFIGRERELWEIRKHMQATRLLNLIGPGGIGKTRMALEVATDLVDQYPDGVWIVDLTTTTRDDHVFRAIADALSLAEQPGGTSQTAVVERLRGAHALVILDNSEHIIAGTSAASRAILVSCPQVDLLVTGREALRVPGTTMWRVPPMGVPGPAEEVGAEALSEYDGLRLFIERATLVRPDFRVDNESAATIGRICQRLDGIPLAIELAAAQVASLSVDEIEERLADRFGLLSGGDPDEPRHATLHAAIASSFDRLSEDEQVLFRRLAVFAGGCTLKAAEAICTDELLDRTRVTPIMHALAQKSMVVPEEFTSTHRFLLLESMREFASEHLEEAGETQQLCARHTDYFVDLAEGSSPSEDALAQRESLDALAEEADNMRSTLSRLDSEGDPRIQTLVFSLYWFWSARGHLTEAAGWIQAALRADGPAADTARVRAAAGLAAMERGDLEEAERHLEASIAGAVDETTRRDATARLADVLNSRGRGDEAAVLYKKVLEESMVIDDHWTACMALNGLAIVADRAGRAAEAARHYEDALAIARRAGIPQLIAPILSNLAHIEARGGRLEEAQRLFGEVLAFGRERDDEDSMATALRGLGEVAEDRGDLAEAVTHYRESLSILEGSERKIELAAVLHRLGDASRKMGVDGSAPHLERALELFRQSGIPHGISAALRSLAEVDRAQGQASRAIERLTDAIGHLRDGTYPQGLRVCLETLAGAVLDSGRPAEAAKLFGAADAIHVGVRPAAALEVVEADRLRVRQAVGDRFDELCRDGARLDVDDAVALAATGSSA